MEWNGQSLGQCWKLFRSHHYTFVFSALLRCAALCSAVLCCVYMLIFWHAISFLLLRCLPSKWSCFLFYCVLGCLLHVAEEFPDTFVCTLAAVWQAFKGLLYEYASKLFPLHCSLNKRLASNNNTIRFALVLFISYSH